MDNGKHQEEFEEKPDNTEAVSGSEDSNGNSRLHNIHYSECESENPLATEVTEITREQTAKNRQRNI